MADGYWYHGSGKLMGEFCHIKPNDKERYGEYVKVKHGRWIYVQLPLPLSNESKECVQCSVCGTHWDNESNYCPNCGARMDGGENG